jgi:lipopolysaccharide transport system permease protein
MARLAVRFFGRQSLALPLPMTMNLPDASRSIATTVIAPRGRWALLDFHELWAYRELLLVLAGRDIRVRYKQTLLGVAWAIIRPLLAMGIFTLVFGRLAKMPSEGAPYAVFVLAALLPWTFFSTAAGTAAESLVASQAMITKIYFPRLLVPLAPLGVAFVDLAIGLLLLAALSAWYGVVPGAHGFILLPLSALLLVLAALAIGTLLSALTASYRDFRHLSPFLLQLWLYATPVVYPASLFPPRWQWVLYLNPVAGPVEGFRAVFLNRPVDWPSLGSSFLVSLAILLLAISYFSRVEQELADVL